MKYLLHLCLGLWSVAHYSAQAYCEKALKEFSRKGYSTCCRDFSNANLSPIIQKLLKSPPLRHKWAQFRGNFRSINDFMLGSEVTLINLKNANISGATISNVDLSMADLDGITCNEQTDFSGSLFFCRKGSRAQETVGAFDLCSAKLKGATLTMRQVGEYLRLEHNHHWTPNCNFSTVNGDCRHGTPCTKSCPFSRVREEKKVIIADGLPFLPASP